MKIQLITVGHSKGRSPLVDARAEYIKRAGRFADVSLVPFSTENALCRAFERTGSNRPGALLLADSGGDVVSSEELADRVRRFRDNGTPLLGLAIGPADGWTAAGRAAAAGSVSFGRITLPHELATLVAAEQLYRALTILAGHPYHSGH